MSAAAEHMPEPSAAAKCVYLLDWATATERSLLLEWIDARRGATERCEIVDLQVRQQPRRTPQPDPLGICMDAHPDGFFIPLRLVWAANAGSPVDRVTLRGLLRGVLRPQWLARHKPGAWRVIEGRGATLADLRRRFLGQPGSGGADDAALAGFVRKSAVLALDREERRLLGIRYKIPRLLGTEILGRPRVVQAMRDIAAETGRDLDSVRREARACLNEMAAAHTPAGIDLAAALGRYLYTRGFDADIELAPGDLERIRELMNTKPVAFGFTHKSHVDGFMLVALFHDRDLTPLHFFGGINMSFFGLGTLMKKGGAIFLRRSFQDDPVYKVVFKNYIDYLGEKRFPLLWALEGTRSRTGKVMPFRYGMINYVASAYAHENSTDLILMPIAVTYDQIPEVDDYNALQAGATKRPESASWFLQYIRRLKRPHGKIHVRFGHGVQLSDFVRLRAGGEVSKEDIQKIAFALAVDVSRVMPITVNALITFAMLTHGHQALTLDELVGELEPLRAWVKARALPATADLASWPDGILERSLQLLASNGVIRRDTSGLEPVYAVAPGAARMAAYYRNATVHFFVRGAIAEVALLAVQSTEAQATAEFRRQALQLRELLRFEFSFEEPAAFLQALEADLDSRLPGWLRAVEQGPAAIRNSLAALPIILSHGALRPFLEAYLLLAEALALQPPQQAVDRKALTARCLALGRQRLLQRRIRCEESVSSSYFENALELAARRGCLEPAANSAQARRDLLQELTAAVGKTQVLAALADSRRVQRSLHA